MRLIDYFKKQDLLVHEDPLFDIPVRKDYLLREIGRGKRVLDLGCFGGKISTLIQKQNNEVYGVELNIQGAAQAQAQGIKVKVFDFQIRNFRLSSTNFCVQSLTLINGHHRSSNKK